MLALGHWGYSTVIDVDFRVVLTIFLFTFLLAAAAFRAAEYSPLPAFLASYTVCLIPLLAIGLAGPCIEFRGRWALFKSWSSDPHYLIVEWVCFFHPPSFYANILIAPLPGCLLGVGCAWISFRRSIPPIPKRRMPIVPRCAKCAYLLYGLPTPRCPECGTAFDPAFLRLPIPPAAEVPGPSR